MRKRSRSRSRSRSKRRWEERHWRWRWLWCSDDVSPRTGLCITWWHANQLAESLASAFSSRQWQMIKIGRSWKKYCANPDGTYQTWSSHRLRAWISTPVLLIDKWNMMKHVATMAMWGLWRRVTRPRRWGRSLRSKRGSPGKPIQLFCLVTCSCLHVCIHIYNIIYIYIIVVLYRHG